MGMERGNTTAVSSKRPDWGDHERELERLRGALCAEKNRNQQAHQRFSVDLRRLREEAEREQQRALRELTARHERQKGLELVKLRDDLSRERAAEVRRLLCWKGQEHRAVGACLERDRQSALRQAKELQRQLAKQVTSKDTFQRESKAKNTSTDAGCLESGVTYCKLEQLLLRLQKQADGEQAAFLQRVRQELDQEKGLFLCHLLDVHGVGQGRQCAAGSARCRSKSSAHIFSNRTQGDGTQSHDTGPPVPGSRSFSQGSCVVAPLSLKRTRQDWLKPLAKRERSAAAHRSCDVVEDTSALPWLWQRVMYDLCTRPEQPEQASADTEMEGRGEPEAPGPQQQEQGCSRQTLDQPNPSTPAAHVPPAAPVSMLGKRHHSLYDNLNGYEGEGLRKNGTDYGFLVRQNSELLRALDEMDKTCTTLKEENCLLRKSSHPETEEKVKRLRRKNTELAVIAKRLEDRARKLQEANLKVVNAPVPLRLGAVEQYKRAFARQRARDLAQHADTLLSKDKEIAALQQECRGLEARLGTAKGCPLPPGVLEFERLLRESQKEVLRLQRQLSVSCDKRHTPSPSPRPAPPEEALEDKEEEAGGGEEEDEKQGQEGKETETEHMVAGETPCGPLDEAPPRCEETPGEEAESGPRVTTPLGSSPTPAHQENPTEEQRLQLLASELSKKRKECENLDHEVRKRQKRCQDLESQLEDEQSNNEQLKEEADLLRRKARLLDQTQVENEELREDLSEVTAQRNSVLEENLRLRAKLENLEQVLKHMREVAERRQQLELEHEQALAILKFKQDEIKRLQRAQFFAKREHEGVVQVLEGLIQLVLRRELSKVRDLEDKCRSQTEQFGLLSHELEKFRLQASHIDLGGTSLGSHPSLSVLTNGVGLTTERDVAAALRLGATPHAAGLSRTERSPVVKHRELPSISINKSASTSSPSKSDATHLTPKSDTHLSPRRSSTHEVDTASEVEELDIDVSPAPYTASRGEGRLHVFIARYSYNPYDGPNDNPEVELPLTAGEYIYVYGGVDDDGFYEGELMDGRRGLVPSNFVERVSDDDMLSAAHPPEGADGSHNSLLDSSLHSASERHQKPRPRAGASERTESPPAASVPAEPAAATALVPVPLTNGLDLDLEEVGMDTVPYPRKLTLIKQLAKSIIIGWDPPLVPAGWGNVWSYNVYVDQELRLNVPFGAQTKAVLERLDVHLKAYRVSVQSLTERGSSEQLRCSVLVGRDVCVAPTQLRLERVTATSASLAWLPSNSNYVHIVSLNEEECELVKAGCYSLCLSNLAPSRRYNVKVEARPHRTPWELPLERREHKSAAVSFTTLMAGPPDAPLGVQLEHGPSPGIALVSWLPVTIDAAGTSNGVRVTGYTVYADRRKVLEVSSPTAGSALLGPSQIYSLQAAQELTVRTSSAHGESGDSAPVPVPTKLAAIMSGQSVPASAPPSAPSYENSAAKVSGAPCASLLHAMGSTEGLAALSPRPLHTEAPLSPLSYVEAWANPSSAAAPYRAALAVHEATSPAASIIITPMVSAALPSSVPTPLATPPPAALTPPAGLGPCRDTDSPVLLRPVISISEYLEDSRAKLHTPEPCPTPPRVTDPQLPQNTPLLRPPISSPMESEAEEEGPNPRLVSIEEFLSQEQSPDYNGRQQQSNGGGRAEPSSCYQVENNRGSDLSDILEEEEEELYSDPPGPTRPRGYTTGANRSDMWEPDSDEEILEKILKLPPQAPHTKQLFSIPEVTDEEDNSQEESLSLLLRRQQTLPVPPRQRDGQRHPRPQPQQEPAAQARPRTQHRVHYAEPLDTVSYPEEEEGEAELDCDANLYPAPRPRRPALHAAPPGRERAVSLIGGLGDRLRREAMLRSQMAVAAGGVAQERYLLSKTVRRVKSPTGPGTEIDVEYGTDSEEPAGGYDGEVVLEQMSSEWWVEGGRAVLRRPKAELQALATSAQQQWVCCPRQVVEPSRPIGDHEVRIFVALFPYDPAAMSPNPDAAEEELPFREGQIIQVYGDKDADGFYRGESAGRLGYVPCNMVSEIQVEDEETRQQLLQQGFLSTEASMEKIGARSHAQLPRRPLPPPKPRRSKKGTGAAAAHPAPAARRMVAIFDYDPRESSPNNDIEAELTFSAGDVIFVYGDMDDDGFFYGDLNGHKGLVPSNFLQAVPEPGEGAAGGPQPASEPRKETQKQKRSVHFKASRPISTQQPQPMAARPEELPRHTPPEGRADMEPAPAPSEEPPRAPDPPAPPAPVPDPAPRQESGSASAHAPADGPTQTHSSPSGKKKKGFFSKGRKLFKKLGSSKRE
ncbi:peripheral-type benzodiazepine receptor-associated protein 1 [Aplochiton taeniatus]